MGSIHSDVFVCLDCESTGLDPENDRIIEIAAVSFTFEKVLDRFESLINPECEILEASQKIHNISKDMVKDKPTIDKVLPSVIKFIEGHLLVGHGIGFDIALIENAAKRKSIPFKKPRKHIDTLRLARLYGESPINSLEKLRQHFNIQAEGAHRAMNDVTVNIEVFKYLCKPFKTTEELIQKLDRPVRLKTMPLGKHKGRRFEEIPIEYLVWAAGKDFDEDLLYSIRKEISTRKKGNQFEQASNPFSSL